MYGKLLNYRRLSDEVQCIFEIPKLVPRDSSARAGYGDLKFYGQSHLLDG